MEIRFVVEGEGVAQPRSRHGTITTATGETFVNTYTPAKHRVNPFKGRVRKAARAVFSGPPLSGPLRLELIFVQPRPGRLVWKRRPMPRLRHTDTPDVDNLAKSVMDALTGVSWVDDAQICEASIQKWIASGHEAPHVEVTITTLGEDLGQAELFPTGEF